MKGKVLTLALCGGAAITAILRAQETGPASVVASPVIVSGENAEDTSGALTGTEAERVGPAKQPEWTTRRVFADTDIYVIPTGTFEVNQFFDSFHPGQGTHQALFETEFENGLPWRTQFDVEVDYSHLDGKTRYDYTLLELSHALADWGKLPLNPTINGGWRFIRDEPDAFFVRLLLADEFWHRIHFGSNLTFDRQIGGEQETSWELNQAVSWIVLQKTLSMGLEMRAEYEKERADRDDEEIDSPSGKKRKFNYSTTVVMGPSLLFKPTRRTHLELVPMAGLTHDSPHLDAFLVFGIDFSAREERESDEERSADDYPVSGPRGPHH